MTYRIRVSIYCLATRRRIMTTPLASAKIPSPKATLISEPVGGSGGVLLCGGGGVSPGGGGVVVLGGVVCDGGGGVMSEGGTVHLLVIKNPHGSISHNFTAVSFYLYLGNGVFSEFTVNILWQVGEFAFPRVSGS